MYSIALPLAFSYSATIFLNEMSSSCAKPWIHHTVAVVAAAFARRGLADAPAAAIARELRSSDRLLRFPTSAFCCCLRFASPLREFCLSSGTILQVLMVRIHFPPAESRLRT